MNFNKLVNMFEVFAYLDLGYIGCPINIDGYSVGAVALMYEQDGNNVPSEESISFLKNFRDEIAHTLKNELTSISGKSPTKLEEFKQKVNQLQEKFEKSEDKGNPLEKKTCCPCWI